MLHLLQQPYKSEVHHAQACSLTSQKRSSSSPTAATRARGLAGVDWVRRTGLRRRLLGLTRQRRELLREPEEIFFALCRDCTTVAWLTWRRIPFQGTRHARQLQTPGAVLLWAKWLSLKRPDMQAGAPQNL